MKKYLSIAIALLIASMAFAGVYTIGTGTATQSYVPTYGLYEYSWSKALYTAAELDGAGVPAGQIDAIGFNVSNSPSNYTQNPIVVYVRHTNATELDETYPNNTQFQEVFNNTYTWNGSGWHQFVFSNPFIWDGVSNIEFLFENLSGTWASGYPVFLSHSTSPTNMAAYKYADGALPTTAGTLIINRPNIQIITPMVTPPGPTTVLSPADGAIYVNESATLNWNTVLGADGYKLYFGTTNPPAYIGDLGNVTTYNPNDMADGTTYYWQVVPYNTYGDATNCPVWSFTTTPAGVVMIGDGTANNNLPVNAYFGYTYSQSIYRQEDINIADQRIEKISFYWNGAGVGNNSNEWVVYMGHTDEETFDSTTSWIPLNELALVYAGTLNIPATAGWITINLTNPFVYNNTQNLVIAVDENKASYDGSSQFFYNTITSGENRSIRYQNDTNNPDPASPPTGTLVAAFPNIMMEFGDLPTVGVPSISPSPVAMGSSYVGFSKTQQVALTNTGGAALTVNSITLASTVDFQLQNLPTLPFTINPGDPAVPFTVVFNPTTAGELSTQLIIGDTRANSSFSVTGTGIQPLEGEICENPYIATLPLVDYNGTTEGYANDYTSEMFTGLTSASYVNGKDWVAKITVPILGNLNITLANQTGAPAYQYMGMFLVNTIPSLASPATVLAQAYGTAPFSIANYTVTPGDYYLIIDNWPTPENIYFTLNITHTPATDPPSPATLVAPADEAIGVSATPTLSWTSGGGVVEKYYISYGTVNPFTTVLNSYDNGTATTYPITSPLNYETEYWWKVSPWNSVAGHAQNLPTWTFTTLVDPTISSFPFFEGFESGYTNGASDLGNWTQLVGPEYSSVYWTANNTETSYNRSPRTGDWNAYLRYAGQAALVRPIQLEAGTGYQIEFYARQDTDTSTGALIQAKLGTAPTLAALTTAITPQTGLVSGDYQKVSGSFTVETSGVYYIGIQGWANYTPWYISLDDIKISEMIAGPPATPILTYPNDAATNMAKDGFDLTWEPDFDTGGMPDYYAVFMSQDADEIFNDFYIEVEDPFFNPVTDSDGEIVFAYEDRWYWTVTAGNTHGESDPADIRSFQIEADPTITNFPWYDGFESYADFSLDLRPWTQYDGDGMTTWGVDSFEFPTQYYVGSFIAFNPNTTTPAAGSGWAPHGGNKFAVAFDANGDANDDWLITPPIQSPGALKFGFWARSVTAQYGLERFNVLISTTDKNPASFTLLNEDGYIEAPVAWTKYEYPINVPANQIFYLAIQCVSDDAFAFFVDDVELAIPQSIDLAINGFTGDSLGQVGTPAVYEVTVANVGLTDVSSYYVYLKDSDNGSTVATMNVAATLAAGTSTVHEISWTPVLEGEYDIYAEVSTAGDTNLANNTAAPIHLTVYAATMNILYVGDPDTGWVSKAMPFNFYYEDSVVETIYLASEMQATSGTIEALVYTNYFDTAEVDNFQIWMKNTDVNDLASGWLPWAGYTLVYDGLMGGPAGLNLIQIPITPFSYTGGNLAIRTSREWMEYNWTDDQYWLITIDENYPNRTRYAYQDADLDIAVPPTGYVSNNFPNIIFFMDTEDMVTSLEAPIVEINLNGTNIDLDWQNQLYAYQYNVYASDDPYTFGDDPEYVVYGGEGATLAPTAGDKQFYKITAETYRDIAVRSTLNRPVKNTLQKNFRSVDIPVHKQIKVQRTSK